MAISSINNRKAHLNCTNKSNEILRTLARDATLFSFIIIASLFILMLLTSYSHFKMPGIVSEKWSSDL